MVRPTRCYAVARGQQIRDRRSVPTLSPTQHTAEQSPAASSQTVNSHKPRGAWRQRGWSEVSPYYANAVTIDRRWDWGGGQ